MSIEQKNIIVPEQKGINIRNETHLHSAVKRWLSLPGDRFEAMVDGSIIDIVRGDLLIEVQTGNFYSIHKKIKRLLKEHEVKIVYPLPAAKWITTIRAGERCTIRRKSPKKGRVEDIFKELIRLPDLVSSDNFSMDILMIEEEETRVDDGKGSWRRKGISIIDRDLIDVVDEIHLDSVMDYLKFIPENISEPFTNNELSKALNININLTRKMTYCMKKIGIIEETGKVKNELLFRRAASVLK